MFFVFLSLCVELHLRDKRINERVVELHFSHLTFTFTLYLCYFTHHLTFICLKFILTCILLLFCGSVVLL